MAWDDNLQVGSPVYGVVSSLHRRIRVLAGPGAGKSFAMKRRVARILEVERVNPAAVLPVTFTRVAAEDLHRELVSLGVPGAAELNGRTLHSLAMSILMRRHVRRAKNGKRLRTRSAVMSCAPSASCDARRLNRRLSLCLSGAVHSQPIRLIGS
jgi:superfamily I DNA/RNA helicase